MLQIIICILATQSIDLLTVFLLYRVHVELTTYAAQPGCLHPGSRSPNRKAIKYLFVRPFSPRRGAEQRAVVAALHRTIGDASASRPCDVQCRPPVASTGGRSGVQGQAFLVTFCAIAKSDWPRAAMEREGGTYQSSFIRPNDQTPGER